MKNAVKPIPEGYHSVTPCFTVEDAPKLLDFVKQVFDAVEVHRTLDADGLIQHAEFRIGDSMLMLSQARGDWKAEPGSVYVYVHDVDATYQRALAAGATSLIVPADQFYGDRSGGVMDSQGIRWWLGTRIEDVSSEEIQRRAAVARKK
jgi:PhnB protein